MENLKAKSFEIREHVLDVIYRAKAGHIGGDMSVTDILVALYFKPVSYTHLDVYKRQLPGVLWRDTG